MENSNLRSDLKKVFHNFVFYNVDRVLLGTCQEIVQYEPSGSLASRFDKDLQAFVYDKVTSENLEGDRSTDDHLNSPTDRLYRVYLRSTPEELGLDEEDVDCAATDIEFTRTMDFVYDDYSVVTKYNPRAGLRREANRAWTLPMSDRVDFSLGIGKKLITQLPKNLKSVPPTAGKNGSIVCVILDPNSPNRRPRWFVASNQLVRFWTLVMYGPDHVSFVKASAKCPDLRTYFMRSVTLSTNGFRKWTLGYHDHGEWTPETAEDEKPGSTRNDRFWMCREEKTASRYCHIYLALTLIMEYEEVLSPKNLPSGGTETPPMRFWDLPEGFFENVIYQLTGRKTQGGFFYPNYRGMVRGTVEYPAQGAECALYWKHRFGWQSVLEMEDDVKAAIEGY